MRPAVEYGPWFVEDGVSKRIVTRWVEAILKAPGLPDWLPMIDVEVRDGDSPPYPD